MFCGCKTYVFRDVPAPPVVGVVGAGAGKPTSESPTAFCCPCCCITARVFISFCVGEDGLGIN